MTNPDLERRLRGIESIANNDFNAIKYLSLDPGSSNGLCGYDAKFYLQFMLTIPASEILKYVDQFKSLDKFIIEGYKVFPNKAKQHIYSDLETPRIIGRIEGWCELNNVPLIKQPSSIKNTAYAWINKKPLPKSNPMNHSLDAHVHFIYWAVTSGKMKAEELLK